MSYKQAILIRHDLGMSKGKCIAQGSHAAVDATLKARKEDLQAWRSEGMAKIALRVDSEKELYKYIQMAKDAGLTIAVITDAGHTQVEPGTVTCGAIGPAKEEDVDALVGHLKLV